MVHVHQVWCCKGLGGIPRWCRCTRRMSPRLKRFMQTVFVAALVAYTTLLAYQLSRAALNTAGSQVDQDSSPSIIPPSHLNLHELIQAQPQHLYRHHMIVDHNLQPALPYHQTTTEPTLGLVVVAATATVRPPATKLDDLFISVKTTRHYHETRLPSILKTWFQLAKAQTWFFTDTDDTEFQRKTNGHMINTNCTSSHHRKALCCKMSVEFDTFINTNKKWFCHFDDDNYVNVPRLVRFLADYNPRDDWYLGKTSIQAPWEIVYKDKKPRQKAKFWFATGGAGFCLSRALALKMMPVASGGKFISTGEKIRLPDDVTMGYIIEHLLKTPLTVIDQFHSHLEPMKFIRREFLQDQISFSYHTKNKDVKNWNVVKVEGFDLKNDPNRFLSLHCYLFPNFNFCPK